MEKKIEYIGAKKYDRVKKLYRNILLCTVITGVVSTLLFEFAPKFVVGLFGVPTNIPNPADYWLFGGMTFRVFLSLVTFTCVIKMTSIFFQAVGKPVNAVVASMIRDIICFIPLILILPLSFGIEGILFAAPCADFISMIIAVALTVVYFKKLGKEKQKDAEVADTVIKPSHKGVIITIAREHGSCGKRIGVEVAKRLSVPCYYKEVTALAAKESGLDKQFISELNENSPAVLHSLYLSTTVITDAIKAQAQIIRKIADNGTCVIVGRAADYVLRENADVIRIFIYAPKAYREKKVMEMYGDTETEAKKNIRHSDEARAAYYNGISGLAWGARENYDLMIDASVGIEKCADTICRFAT